MKMKAMVYNGPKKLQIEEVNVPEIGDRDILVKVKYCGVCGTDIHIYQGDGGSFEVTPPLIMGHELSGIVEQTGKLVTKVKKGDLVSVDPNDMCGECYFCKNAMEQFCLSNKGYGTTVDGGFAEYIVAGEKQVFLFREGTDALTAAMAEPLSCCIHGIDLCNITTGSEVLVMGGGPIGLIMMQLARMSGAAKVILSEPVAEKRELGLKLGADLVVDPMKEDLEEVLRNNCKNINTVIECVGNPKTIENAIDLAGKGATVMLFGLTGPDAKINVRPDVVFKKELKITSSFINPYSFERAISVIESGRINVTDVITDIVKLENAISVFENPEYRRKGKVVVKMF